MRCTSPTLRDAATYADCYTVILFLKNTVQIHFWRSNVLMLQDFKLLNIYYFSSDAMSAPLVLIHIADLLSNKHDN